MILIFLPRKDDKKFPSEVDPINTFLGKILGNPEKQKKWHKPEMWISQKLGIFFPFYWPVNLCFFIFCLNLKNQKMNFHNFSFTEYFDSYFSCNQMEILDQFLSFLKNFTTNSLWKNFGHLRNALQIKDKF